MTLDLVISNNLLLSDDEALLEVDNHYPVINIYFTESQSMA